MDPDGVWSVKVCPYCGEELDDRATSCMQCHRDPSVVPPWTVPKRPGEEPPWWAAPDTSEGLGQQGRVPDPLDGVPGPDEALEPAAARESPADALVWSALVFAIFGGGLVGLVLGITARRRIMNSNGRRGGLVLANIAIGISAVTLLVVLVLIAAYLLERAKHGAVG